MAQSGELAAWVGHEGGFEFREMSRPWLTRGALAAD